MLPKELRAELDRKLLASAFSNYRSLKKLLADAGYQISRGSLQRYGADFETRLAAVSRATAQAKAVVESSSDREGAMSDALMQLVQSRIFDALIQTEHLDEGTLARFARAVADLGRTTVQQKKWSEELRVRLSAAEKKITEIGSAAGLSPEAAQAIRAALLGVDFHSGLYKPF